MIEPRKITNPFPGLRPFETKEYRLFFGREGQSDELLARLQRAHFLAVVGTSGSGKSSLIRAGMLPALRGGMMAGAGAGWRVAVMRPGSDPFGELACALGQPEVLPGAGGGLPPAEGRAVIEATLRSGSLGLVNVARQARLAEHEKLLVVVDQFEELFRFRAARPASSTGDDASAFVKLLLEAARQRDVSIYVVLTMRSDFLGDCSQFQGLPEAINDGQYLIPRMTRDERRVAITGPVGVTRGKMSEPLVNRLLNDVGDNPDQLPILQHALMRTWDFWKQNRRDGAPIGLEHYEAIGTMSDALSRHADEAWRELPDEHSHRIAELLFKALTERGADNREIRRPTRLRDICEIAGASREEVVAVIDVFRREGRSFLMPPAGVALTPETVIDISHESLIRNWERLKDWVNEEAQSARVYRRLAETAVLHGEGHESLLTGAGLLVALDWREKAGRNAAWAARYHPAFAEALTFLDESKAAHDAAVAADERQREEQSARERRELEMAQRYAEQQRRAAHRLRGLLAAIAVMLLLALGTAAYAWTARNSALAARKDASDKEALAKNAQRDAENSAREAREAQARAEQSERDVAAGAARLKEEKEKTDKALADVEAAVEAQKKALAAQKRATELAEDQKHKAEANLKSFNLSVERSSENVLGAAYFQREDYANALEHFGEALSTLEKEQARPVADEHTRLVLTVSQVALLSNLGAAQRKLGESDKSKFDEAVKSYKQADDIMSKLRARFGAGTSLNQDGQRTLNEDSQWTLFDVYHGLAHAYRDRARHAGEDKVKEDDDSAEEYFKKALEIQKELLKDSDPVRLASGYENLARHYRDLGNYEKAEPLYQNILELRAKLPDKRAYVATLRTVAKFYSDQKKYDLAAARYEQAIDVLTEKEDGDDEDMHTLAETYSDLGEVYAAQEGGESKSKSAFQLSRAYQDLLLRAKQGLDSMSLNDLKGTLASFEALADAYAGLGNYEQAAEAYQESLDRNDIEVAGRVLHKLAALTREHLKKYDEAEVQYKELLVLAEKYPADSPITLSEALRDLGSLYANEMDRPAEGEPLLKRSLDVSLNGPKGKNLLETNKSLAELAKLYRRQNRTSELESAVKLRAENAGKILSDAFGRMDAEERLVGLRGYAQAAREYVEANGELAALHLAQRKEDDALAVYRAMLGDPTKAESNPATCCIRLRYLVEESALALYAKTLNDYHQLLVARRMSEEAEKVADYIKKVRERQEDAKKLRGIL